MAATKRARKIRQRQEFDLRSLIPTVRSPIVPQGAYSWTLQEIMDARDMQMRGYFQNAVRLAESMRTDDAMNVAYQNRLAPFLELQVKVTPASKGQGAAIAAEGEALFGQAGVALTEATILDLVGTIANHGLAIGVNIWTPRPDGSRVDVEHKMFPLEFVWWNQPARCFMARIDPYPTQDIATFGAMHLPKDPYGNPQTKSNLVPIVHGDGRWVVYSKHDFLPFRQDAALLPGALVWAAHAFGMRDWAKGSASHGNAKVVGTMPQGMSLQDAEGVPSDEAAAFVELLRAIASDDSPFGLKPFGSELSFLTNNSSAWQVWQELTGDRKKAAARIYLGTDGTLGAQGGAPGVDIQQLFGVAVTKIIGDTKAITNGFRTGTIEPWAAINFGDSTLAPSREYVIPEPNADAARESFAKRNAAFNADIKAARENGFLIDQDFVHTLAEKYGVPEPTLGAVPSVNSDASTATPEPQPQPEPTDSPKSEPAQAIDTSATDSGPSPSELLAAKMTEAGVDRCEHGSSNRCRMCGVERVRDFDVVSGQTQWRIGWRAIEATPA